MEHVVLPPQQEFATGHDWAVFLAPQEPLAQHMSNERYYFERNNGITTWIRPFDYIEPPNELVVGEQWRAQENERKLQLARQRAKQDKPARQSHVRGSLWVRVETQQGRVYFHNRETKQSRWDQPPDLPMDLPVDVPAEEEEEAEGGTEMNAEDAEWMLAQMDANESEGDELSDLSEEIPEEIDEAEQRLQGMSKPDRVRCFTEMLREAEVNPFGTWDACAVRLENDWRIRAVTDAGEREDLFADVCRELLLAKQASAKRKRMDDSLAADDSLEVDPFAELLREKVKKKTTSFARFCQKNLKDPRYLGIKTSRERERRFNQHVAQL
ncbi:transcription elongation regulator [Coemansia sp. RSA 552]|nr:transcription elongation regulator [Coemansia sp. RSA 552]